MRFYTTIVSRLILRKSISGHSLTSGPSVSLGSLAFTRPYYTPRQWALKKKKNRNKLVKRTVADEFSDDEWPVTSEVEVSETVNPETFHAWLNMGDQPEQEQEQKQADQKNDRGKRLRPQEAGHKQRNMKREFKKGQKRARKRERDMTTGSSEEVLAMDIRNLTESLNRDDEDRNNEADGSSLENLPEEGSEIEIDVVELASTGEGLALQKGSKRIYVVPFAVPGDTVKVKVYRHLREEGYTVADFISVVTPSPSRDDSRIQCKYFATCSGCQFQMLDYAEQLRLKQRVVEKAFRHFSQLPPELVPAVQDTVGSPLQYGYRTKLTPHFDGPPGWRKNKESFKECPPIGFMFKGKRTTIDIEDCPIGTDAVRLGMRSERERMAREYGRYTRGATILLRESTKRIPKKQADSPPSPSPQESATGEAPRSRSPSIPPPDVPSIRVETEEYTDIKTCVTDNNGESTEYVGPYVFRNMANAFFQNNNSILPVITSYISSHILPPASSPGPPVTRLIDAYSGSGLFTIALSPLISGGSVGIDISDASITYASRNARANKLSPDRARFVAADAKELFIPAVRARYPADETVVVLDPPRKGCDVDFLRQLLDFGPRRIVYVSCNVHTQARDVGILVRGEVDMVEDGDGDGDGEGGSGSAMGAKAMAAGKSKARYAIESLRGFDFFPQTSHVEGVCVLSRVEDEAMV